MTDVHSAGSSVEGSAPATAAGAVHSPLPWKRDQYGRFLLPNGRELLTRGMTTCCAGDSVSLAEANSDFIERSCNSHYELLAYAKCEEARSHHEDIAETVLKQHGWNPSECTSHEFMDRMRRAALSKVQS